MVFLDSPPWPGFLDRKRVPHTDKKGGQIRIKWCEALPLGNTLASTAVIRMDPTSELKRLKAKEHFKKLGSVCERTARPLHCRVAFPTWHVQSFFFRFNPSSKLGAPELHALRWSTAGGATGSSGPHAASPAMGAQKSGAIRRLVRSPSALARLIEVFRRTHPSCDRRNDMLANFAYVV